MFIDQSYFTGPLTIAQLGQQTVIDSLNDFINRFEARIMQAALGYDFYQAFLDGLDQGSDEQIESRWSDLLSGCTFTNVSGIKKYFSGFAGNQNASTIIAAQRNDLFIYAGVTPGFSVGNPTYLDSSLSGWNFDLELVGFGTLNPATDWIVIPGGISLNPASVVYHLTSYNERWVIHFTSKKISIVSYGVNQNSPLAGFIYYEYMKDLATQVTGIGVVKSQSENSTMANPIKKMCQAYNDSVDQIQLFWEFMQADQQLTNPIYPEFSPSQVIGYNYGIYNGWRYWQLYKGTELYSFRYINPFGL